MSQSIRLQWVAWLHNLKGQIQLIAQRLRHIVVEPKPRHDCSFVPQGPIGPYATSGGGQDYNVLAAKISGGSNAVDYQFLPLTQIDKEGFVAAHYRHQACSFLNFSQPGNRPDMNKLPSKLAEVESEAA